ncbi:hypothetical protein EWM64_g7317 [Hericium alpestre]|uniref:Uncharacterized protein n=1 Tax=Hericium alpestre TaxID=135208 RepID=A0A4Y9ZR14_9AGAM|nr:hypothetical protein EWM64_g7317 [Hericium alpestre]
MPAIHRLLAISTLAISALANPLSPIVARDNSTTFQACTSPLEVSTTSVQVGNNTVTLTTLACTSQLQSNGLLGILCPILGLFCPCPPPKPKPPKTKTFTTTKTATKLKTTTDVETKTKTKTVTSVQTSTVTDTDSKTKTEVFTTTAVVTETDTETDTLTATETDTLTLIGTTTETDTITDTATVTATATITETPPPLPSPSDVCGKTCTTTCSEDGGQLPPDSDDCQVIKDSIAIFEGNSGPTFTVDPLHIQQLVFGTCRYFFENLGTTPLEYCWQDLATTGGLAGTQCFPPNTPFSTLAICESADQTWEVGVSHA